MAVPKGELESAVCRAANEGSKNLNWDKETENFAETSRGRRISGNAEYSIKARKGTNSLK